LSTNVLIPLPDYKVSVLLDRPMVVAVEEETEAVPREDSGHGLEVYTRTPVRADALQAGEMEAIERFPEGSYRPQLPFLGMPAPPRPPSPPTRPLEIEESECVKRVAGRGAIPIVEVGGRMWSGSPDHPT